jgi:hypothetical protein
MRATKTPVLGSSNAHDGSPHGRSDAGAAWILLMPAQRSRHAAWSALAWHEAWAGRLHECLSSPPMTCWRQQCRCGMVCHGSLQIGQPTRDSSPCMTLHKILSRGSLSKGLMFPAPPLGSLSWRAILHVHARKPSGSGEGKPAWSFEGACSWGKVAPPEHATGARSGMPEAR